VLDTVVADDSTEVVRDLEREAALGTDDVLAVGNVLGVVRPWCAGSRAAGADKERVRSGHATCSGIRLEDVRTASDERRLDHVAVLVLDCEEGRGERATADRVDGGSGRLDGCRESSFPTISRCTNFEATTAMYVDGPSSRNVDPGGRSR